MENRQAIVLLAAYCCAILAGLILLEITVILAKAAGPVVSGKTEFSWSSLRHSIASMMHILPVALIIGFPLALFGALPFTGLFLAAAGKFWPTSQKSFVIYGSIIPGFSILILLAIFIPPPITTINPTGIWPIDYWPFSNQPIKSFMDYTLSMLNFIILAMPSGAFAGYVFWRMGFRNDPVNQQKMNVKT
ncbi:hypothetical protein ACQZ4R_08570 [Agrobacterium vitis]|nr:MULTISPECIES: hypothetical protein [Rhizobium/Agrobacterium group]MCF1470724.1 hypothetical protein [Allorhizobium ampelinum]MVA52552.1 hypothetical protein [Agrobacterium vitis]NSZ53801.1 hypothetical protein [Agrobacterium vitis]NTA32560.1 hypothetical protein [Agrobacterium vitis]